eukprot:GHRR01033522.1.p1 GENE.GHRR01033522.1~~GHRR01033522.1.p1  ORF type:complete len:112 (+),score=23.10 GHRR01033522.1:754-1089(+)
MPLLQKYKAFVKRHPSIVLNAERLLHWVAWNPERFHGSEYAYEAFNAAVGLLGIYNESILADHPEYSDTIAKWALWLAAVEQVSCFDVLNQPWCRPGLTIVCMLAHGSDAA